MNTKHRRYILIAITILWMIFIYFFSSQTAAKSTEVSDSVIVIICRLFVSNFKSMGAAEQAELVDSLTFIVRKAAHASIYAVLGIWITAVLHTTALSNKASLLIAVILCFIYASTDEFHQLFVPGRSGEFRDVCIDTTGAFVGCLFYNLAGKLIRRLKSE